MEQPSKKPCMLKSLFESAQQKQISVVTLHNQIRNLLDLEGYTKEYGESDVYLAMIIRTNWLLQEKLSKGGYASTVNICLQGRKGNYSWRTRETAPEVASFQTSRSLLLTSRVSFHKAVVSADESPSVVTPEATSEFAVCAVNSKSCVTSQPQD